jgi:hypothetical protein
MISSPIAMADKFFIVISSFSVDRTQNGKVALFGQQPAFEPEQATTKLLTDFAAEISPY